MKDAGTADSAVSLTEERELKKDSPCRLKLFS